MGEKAECVYMSYMVLTLKLLEHYIRTRYVRSLEHESNRVAIKLPNRM